MNRRFGLDLLRTIAILTVVEQHGRAISNLTAHYFSYLGYTDGVDIFFVLSGFLIGGILVKEYETTNNTNVKKFWIRRWLRTLPNYYIALTINIIIYLFFLHRDFSIKDALLHIAFIQNYLPPYNDFRFFSEAWSLSIEEHFYFLLPLLLLFFKIITGPKSSTKLIIGLSLTLLIIFPILLRIFYYQHLTDISNTTFNNSFRIIIPMRMDSLGIGVLAALIKNNYKKFWYNKNNSIPLLITGIILLIIFDRTWLILGIQSLNPVLFCLYFTLYSLSVSFILPFLDTWQPKHNLATKTISYISTISYSMYLYHNSIFAIPFKEYTENLTHESAKVGLYILYWILVLAVSSITYYLIEKPILLYRDKKFKS